MVVILYPVLILQSFFSGKSLKFKNAPDEQSGLVGTWVWGESDETPTVVKSGDVFCKVPEANERSDLALTGR